MTQLRTVDEVARNFNNELGFMLQPSNDTMKAVRLAHIKVKAALTQDRAAIAAALKEKIEHLRRTDDTEMSDDHVYDGALDDVLAGLKEILPTEDNK